MCQLFCARRIHILVLILCWLQRTNAAFKLTNVICIIEDESLLRLEYCRLKAVRRDVAELSVRAYLLKPVRDCMLQIQYLRRHNGYKPFLFNTTVDACWFLKTLKTHKDMGMLTLIWNSFGKYTNFNHSCPYEGVVFIEKFYPEYKDFRNLPWPTGEYMLKLTFSMEKKIRVRVHVSYTFTEIEKTRKKLN